MIWYLITHRGFWTTLGDDQEHEEHQAFSGTKRRNTASVKEEVGICDCTFYTFPWHLRYRNKDSYISLDNQAYISIAAPGAQSVHGRSSQVKPRSCEKRTWWIKIKAARQSRMWMSSSYIHGKICCMSCCRRVRHTSFRCKSEGCCWHASNSSTIWQLSWGHINMWRWLNQTYLLVNMLRLHVY